MLQKIFKFDKKQVYSRKFELYDYIWYRNHRLFFHSLFFEVENYEHLIFLCV